MSGREHNAAGASADSAGVDQIVAASWVVPVEPRGVVLEDHAVLIAAGRIVALMPREQALAAYPGVPATMLPEHVLMPGLVNAHTHAAMALMRGIADDLPLMTWLNDHIWPAEGKVMGPDFVREGTELAIAEMLRGGTTCISDMYFFPDVAAAVARRMGMRAMLGLLVIDFPTAWASSADQYFSKAMEVHDQLAGDALLRSCIAPHAPYTVCDENLERVRTLADQLEVPVHMHVHETAQEVADSVKQHGVRPLARLQRLGLVNNSLIAVHMTQLTSAEIEACAEGGVSVVHCPESNLKLASGFCPTAALLEAGVNVAIGTDGSASNNDLDMFGEMRSAALLSKAVASRADVFDSASALEAATLGGARALGWDQEIGSLLPGKAADMVAVDFSGLHNQPVLNPLSHLVYVASRHQVSDVWVAGRRRVKGGRLVDVDEAALKLQSQRWISRLRAS